MSAYNFKRQFVAPIQAGTKHHTIRADRKDGRVPKVGELLYLYCGMRTEGCFRILPDGQPCKGVQRVHVSDDFDGAVLPTLYLDGDKLDRDECKEYGTAFFMKQLSAQTPAKGAALIPADLLIRQLPGGSE